MNRHHQPGGSSNANAPAIAQIEYSYPSRPTLNIPTSADAPKHRDDFEIAIICALPLEADAVQALFDIHWENNGHNYGKAPGDPNSYSTGAIGRHNVVLASMPGMGKGNAASVAANCRHSFSGIKLALLVGICGGVPFVNGQEELVLGDVVISEGLIQYDFGRRFPNGFVMKDTPTDSFSRPNQEIRSLLAKLKTNWAQKTLQDKMSEYLSILQERLGDGACYPGPSDDKLFKSNYNHKHQDPLHCNACRDGTLCNQAIVSTCEDLGCDESRLLPRQRLQQLEQTGHTMRHVVHFGLVASGDTVMKSGEDRDRIAASDSVIAFEMEGAGVWDNLPCLVVKGVCDYADSHKNKQWQIYAAATAAACVKAFLENWAVATSFQSESQYSTDLVSSIDVVPMHPDDPLRFLVLAKRPEWQISQEWSSPDNIFESISNYEPDRTYGNHFRIKCPGTVGWILGDDRLKRWVEGDPSCLWLSGKIGSGKTIVTSVIIRHLTEISQRDNNFVAHFFYSQSNKNRLEAGHLFRSFIKQIIGFLDTAGLSCPQGIVSSTKRLFVPLRHLPSFEEIIDHVFMPLTQFLSDHCPNTTYIVDGLDECELHEVHKTLRVIRKLSSLPGRKVLVSGRESLDVKNFIENLVTITISDVETKEDIRQFIDWKIAEKLQERRLTEEEWVLQHIKDKLNDKADQMILWVNLQIEALWDECYTDADIKLALGSLPNNLTETYDRCLQRISSRQSGFAWRILRWVCTVPKPFKIEQLREALGINSTSGRLDWDSLPSLQEVLKCCHNLITLDDNMEVLITHHSVRQHLKRRKDHDKLLPEGFDLDTSELELGELCLLHLTSQDYALALQSSSNDSKFQFSSKAVERLSESVPSIVRGFLPKPRNTLVFLPRKAPRASPSKKLPSFFHFAKDQWAPLTRTITRESTCWGKFRMLVLEPNSSWDFQPWEHAPSRDSYYSELLGWTIANGHTPMLELLMSLQNPKPKDEIFNLPLYRYSYIPALHLASRKGNYAMIVQLLTRCDTEILDVDQRTALHHAAESGASGVAELLVDNKVPLNAIDGKGETSIFIAASNDHGEMVRTLASLGADPNNEGPQGKRIIQLAVENGLEETLMALAHTGVDFHVYYDQEKKSLLHIAAQNGHPAIISILVRYLGMNIHNKDLAGLSGLHYASAMGHKDVVGTLLKLGANPNDRDNNGWMPLHCASENIHGDVVRLLVEHGAEADEKDDAGWTPLFHASNTGATPVVQALIQLGSNPNEKDIEGFSALHYASLNGHEVTSQMLVELGAMSIRAKRNTKYSNALCWVLDDRADGQPIIVSSSVNSNVTGLLTQLQHENEKELLMERTRTKAFVVNKIILDKHYNKYSKRVLGRSERPFIIQHRLIKQVGYESRDNIPDVCKSDNGYLFRFLLVPSSKTYTFNIHHDFSEMTTNMDLSGRSLIRFPRAAKTSASRVFSLNLSRNPDFNLRIHSLQAYENLRELQLTNNQLNQLPSYFSNFKSLRTLNLPSNSLKLFPYQISSLETLVDLDVSFNALEGLPDIFSNFLALRTFAAAHNKLQGNLPQSLGTLKRLRNIDLRSNNLSDISILFRLELLETLLADNNSILVFIFMTGFDSLQTLSLHASPITRFELRGAITNITSLNVSKGNLTNIPGYVFLRAPNLTQLVLDDNQLVSLPDEIGQLKQLRHLSVARNKIRGIPSQIGSLKKLRYLDARQNKIQTLPSDIWFANDLMTLNVSSNSLHRFPTYPEAILLATSPTDLQNIRVTTLVGSLRRLFIADNLLCGYFEELWPLSELRVLNLSYNKLTRIPLGSLQSWPNIEKLYLSGNQLTAFPLNELGKKEGQFLEVIHLNGNRLRTLSSKLTQASRCRVLDCGSNLLHLHVLNERPFATLPMTPSSLRYLNFSGNSGLILVVDSDVSIVPVLNAIRILGLEDVKLITLVGSSSLPSQTVTHRIRSSTPSSLKGELLCGLSDSLGDHKYVTIIDLTPTCINLTPSNTKDPIIMVGIIAGNSKHGIYSTSMTARFVHEKIQIFLTEQLEGLPVRQTPVDALRRTFLSLNKELAMDEYHHRLHGFTESESRNLADGAGDSPKYDYAVAAIAILQGPMLYVANVGDAQVMIIHLDGGYSFLTQKHDPSDPEERERIWNAGGWVSKDGKLNDVLKVSRAFGCARLIPVVIAKPHITETVLKKEDQLLIIASGELWEFLAPDLVASIALSEGGNLTRAAEKLRDLTIAYGSTESVMVMVLDLGDYYKSRLGKQ